MPRMAPALFVLFCLSTALCTAEPPVAALFAPGGSPQRSAVEESVSSLFMEAGWSVERLDPAAFSTPGALDAARQEVLLVPDASRLPLDSMASIAAFLEDGGDLVAMNTPAWREVLVPHGGEWVPVDAFRAAYAREVEKTVLVDFAKENLAEWGHSFRTPELAGTYTVHPAGGDRLEAVFAAEITKLDGWDSHTKQFNAPPFPEGNVLTVFSARSIRNATHLAIEWEERDGSRWIASVPLSKEWRQYLLTPSDFKFWESVPAREKTAFNPANAHRMAVTLAFTHTGFTDRDLAYEVGTVFTAPLAPDAAHALEAYAVPRLEVLSPAYKFFQPADVASLRPVGFLPEFPSTSLPTNFMALHPRPQAPGFDKGRNWVWEPLLVAESTSGEMRGTVAAMMSHVNGPFQGGRWVSFAVQDVDWYLSDMGRAALSAVAKRLRNPLALVDGGSDHYTYFEDQTPRLGVTVANMGRKAVPDVRARFSVTENGQNLFSRDTEPVTIPPGGLHQVAVPHGMDWASGSVTISVSVESPGASPLSLTQQAHVWRPAQEKRFVTAKDGRFELGGARWRPHGVNYMPSSGIAAENMHYFEQWLSAESYDPLVIQRDLDRCKAMGFNSLSIFLYRDHLEEQNLLDLLRRMEALGMKANLSLRPGTPMDFPWEQVREMIEHLRLAENDTVFAYDLAWEPQFRPFERDPFNAAWEAWIVERYGSLENAEKDWGFPVPRDAQGNVVNFSEEMIGREGPWSPMIAAYRRFLDTLLYEKYSRARDFVRAAAPHQHVSFRMSMAGDPTDTQTNTMLYDFAYLGGAVDLFEPEAYGRIGDWERVKPGWFTQEYARWANPALPMIWAEAGVHVWDMASMSAPQDKLDYQARYFDDFYKMMIASGADGIYWWWYPGGFRTNENSDYGIINPDGTDRPVTEVIRRRAVEFINGPDPAPVDTWLVMDRDAHTNGLSGIYTALAADFWEAVAAEKTPGLRTEGTGTNSANCPLEAVGNRPGTGQNPPKFLDAFFDAVEILPEQGILRVTLTNLGEATLLGEAEAGLGKGVACLTFETEGLKSSIPIPNSMPRFARQTVDVPLDFVKSGKTVMSLEAKDRTPFGPKKTITITP